MRHYLDEWIVLACRGKLLPLPRPKLLVFNWRKIALQYCIGLCRTSAWTSHMYTRVPFLFNLPFTSHSLPPLQVVTEPQFEVPESYGKFPLAIYLHMVEVRFLRQSPYLTFFAVWIWDLVKIIVTVLQTIKKKVTSDVCGTQTLKDFNINSH